MIFEPMDERTLRGGSDQHGKLRFQYRIFTSYTAAQVVLSYGGIVRLIGCLLFVMCVAACPISNEDKAAGLGGDSSGSNGTGNTPQFCTFQSDCALAAATCCSCPSFAVNVKDPSHRACSGVVCPPGMDTCPANVEAICSQKGLCELACSELQCQASCPDGYSIDDTTGCLSCTCAIPANRCVADTQCVETRADCCGCHSGGADTSVLAGERGSYDASLGCPTQPTCPAINTCEPGAAPHCIQGDCKLVVAGQLPANACGRSDLPMCPSGQVCTVNQDPAASVLGVGSCVPR